MARDYSNRRFLNTRGSSGSSCGCPAGAKKVRYKKKKGFSCMKEVADAPRFVKKLSSGKCPFGAKKTKNGGCMPKGRGMRIVRKLCK